MHEDRENEGRVKIYKKKRKKYTIELQNHHLFLSRLKYF